MKRQLILAVASSAACALALGSAACSSSEPTGKQGITPGAAVAGGGAGLGQAGALPGQPPPQVVIPAGGASGGSPPTTGEITVYTELPGGFTAAQQGGHYLLGPLEQAGDISGADQCANVIYAVARDFTSAHPDFEKTVASQEGIVLPLLGDDRKPVYAPDGATAITAGRESFDTWYRNVEGLNQAFVLALWLEPNDGIFTFDSSAFFPLDGVGFPETGWADDGKEHNFHFTVELHTEFVYRGGESFRFTGDDDVFVFVNRRLAIDLGGVHSAMSSTLELDARATELGLEIGGTYELDLFQAERHTSGSNFRVDTGLDFTNCGTILPIDLPH